MTQNSRLTTHDSTVIPPLDRRREELRQHLVLHRLLDAGLDVLHRELVGLHFVLADDHDVGGARALGRLERLLQPEVLVTDVDAQALLSQFVREL